MSNFINNVSINDDGDLFTVSLDSGIRIYSMEPLVGKEFIDSNVMGSVSICKLLSRTNLIAIVGGGTQPKFADNTLLIWDDSLKKFVLEFTFATRVLSVVLRRDRLFVAERFRINCFSFPNSPKKLFGLETRDNPDGIFTVNTLNNAAEIQLLAYPGHRIGSVQLLDLKYANSTQPQSSEQQSPLQNVTTLLEKQISNSLHQIEINDLSAVSSSISPCSLSAHTSEIACLALNQNGTLLATASRKGTLIRIFRTIEMDTPSSIIADENRTVLNPQQLIEFRRGIDQALVYCIVFSPDSDYLLVSSDKGTVHIFALKELQYNKRSSISSVPLVNINFSNYALTKFTVTAECACVCCFGPDPHSVYAVCFDGTFHKYHFKNEGTCVRDNFDNFLDVPIENDHILL
ncbi:hypothetical protein NH340_JMT08047 [Sarcoptes scabiei]|uniref:WD repeat domain phosphoinositide-interacting protein 4-like protein n=1 Tax=Sarcoptes scabiei TaxID=52283 RepID=A0A132AC71_SARSC|nr:hypothetical protein QR98_0071180 [Sarcoptes scabiei]UXI22104.1 hypothetical protein NH340_JMT08047 [Sarcoptes scabiei]